MVDALYSAGEILQYKGSNGKMFPLTRVNEDVEAFLKTTDYVEQEIINHQSKDPRMVSAQESLRKVQERNIGCKLGHFELNPARANPNGSSNNEAGTLTEAVRQIREKMAGELVDCAGEYQVMVSGSDLLIG